MQQLWARRSSPITVVSVCACVLIDDCVCTIGGGGRLSMGPTTIDTTLTRDPRITGARRGATGV